MVDLVTRYECSNCGKNFYEKGTRFPTPSDLHLKCCDCFKKRESKMNLKLFNLGNQVVDLRQRLASDYWDTTCFLKDFLELVNDIRIASYSESKEDSEVKDEKVNHPSHYQGNGLEAKQVISAFDLNFSLGNSIKYILRCNKKGNKIEDLKKAIWYLNEEIEDCQKNRQD